MFERLSEQQAPTRRFATREEAKAVADEITNTPRRGLASVLFVGAFDAWIVEVNARANRYGEPAVLREDGRIAKYH